MDGWADGQRNQRLFLHVFMNVAMEEFSLDHQEVDSLVQG